MPECRRAAVADALPVPAGPAETAVFASLLAAATIADSPCRPICAGAADGSIAAGPGRRTALTPVAGAV